MPNDQSSKDFEAYLSPHDMLHAEDSHFNSKSSSLSLSNQQTLQHNTNSMHNVSDSRDTTKFI